MCIAFFAAFIAFFVLESCMCGEAIIGFVVAFAFFACMGPVWHLRWGLCGFIVACAFFAFYAIIGFIVAFAFFAGICGGACVAVGGCCASNRRSTSFLMGSFLFRWGRGCTV